MNREIEIGIGIGIEMVLKMHHLFLMDTMYVHCALRGKQFFLEFSNGIASNYLYNGKMDIMVVK